MPNPLIVTPLHNDEGLICRGVTFTGSNYLSRGGPLTGVANSKKGIFSGFFLRPETGGPLGNRYVINHGPTADPTDTGSRITVHHDIRFEETDLALLSVQLQSSALDDILQMASEYLLSAAVTWHHYFAWWDLETPGSSGTRIDGGPTVFTSYSEANDTIDYDTPEFFVCGGTGGSYFAGDVAKLYYAPGQWLDGSDETVLRKFLGTNGKPRDIGIDGSIPTGTPPLVFLNIAEGGVAEEFAVNRGTGGDLTIVGGLALSATSPSD